MISVSSQRLFSFRQAKSRADCRHFYTWRGTLNQLHDCVLRMFCRKNHPQTACTQLGPQNLNSPLAAPENQGQCCRKHPSGPGRTHGGQGRTATWRRGCYYSAARWLFFPEPPHRGGTDTCRHSRCHLRPPELMEILVSPSHSVRPGKVPPNFWRLVEVVKGAHLVKDGIHKFAAPWLRRYLLCVTVIFPHQHGG